MRAVDAPALDAGQERAVFPLASWPAGARRRPHEDIPMQFELTSGNPDPAVLAAAMRPVDPDARIALDAARGRLEVLTSATTVQVMNVLEAIGWTARPLLQEVHISGGSTCCGHCG
jgi:copper chaperone